MTAREITGISREISGRTEPVACQLRSSFQLFRRNQRELIRLVDRYDAWVAASYKPAVQAQRHPLERIPFCMPQGKKARQRRL